MTDWLLIETFGDKTPSIIGIGDRPRRFGALDKQLRNSDFITQHLQRATRSRTETLFANGRRRLIIDPLLTFEGDRHGAWVWAAPVTEEIPQRTPAGAWYFNLTTDTIGGSNDLLDLYRQPMSERHEQRRTAEAFTRLVTNDDVARAFAVIIQSPVGAEHQAVWTVHCDDGEDRAAHFSCRAVSHLGQVLLRGITHDIGPAQTTTAAPGPVVLERVMLDSIAEPGTYRATVNIRTGAIIRWEGTVPDELDWTALDSPFIHPDDQPVLRALHDTLNNGSTEQTLRLRHRAPSETWQQHRVIARPIALDPYEGTMAAFWTIYPTA